MNGKQAKRLRRAAMGLAVTLDEAGKDIKKDGYRVIDHAARGNASSIIGAYDPKGVLPRTPPKTYVEADPIHQLVVREDSLKGIYKKLKGGKV